MRIDPDAHILALSLSVTQIRPPRQHELAVLQDIERDASQSFADIGLVDVASDEPPSIDELERFLAAGQAWVRVTDHVAYLLAATVDDCVHVVQVSVTRGYASRGLGAALIDHVATLARNAGRSALTLTTFRDVAWNAPYYRRLGFEVLAPDAYGQELAALVKHEATSIPGMHLVSRCADGSPHRTTAKPNRSVQQRRFGQSGSIRRALACVRIPTLCEQFGFGMSALSLAKLHNSLGSIPLAACTRGAVLTTPGSAGRTVSDSTAMSFAASSGLSGK